MNSALRQSVPSASLRQYNTVSSAWYARGLCCHPEGPWHGGELSKKRILCRSTRENTKSYPWEGTVLGTCTPPPADLLDSSYVEKDLGFPEKKKSWSLAGNIPSHPKRPTASCIALGRTLPAAWRKCLVPCKQYWLGHIWNAGFSTECPRAEEERK